MKEMKENELISEESDIVFASKFVTQLRQFEQKCWSLYRTLSKVTAAIFVFIFS